MPFSSERMTSAIDDQSAFEHFHRYSVARDICTGKEVLDVALGEDFGAALLPGVAGAVVDGEIDAACVAHARIAHSVANVEFLEGDAQALPLPDAIFDVVISFESLEHLCDHCAFLHKVRWVLRPGISDGPPPRTGASSYVRNVSVDKTLAGRAALARPRETADGESAEAHSTLGQLREAIHAHRRRTNFDISCRPTENMTANSASHFRQCGVATATSAAAAARCAFALMVPVQVAVQLAFAEIMLPTLCGGV